jgi:hypothetical protein
MSRDFLQFHYKFHDFDYILIPKWDGLQYIANYVIEPKFINDLSFRIVRDGRVVVTIPCERIIQELKNMDFLSYSGSLNRYRETIYGNWINLNYNFTFRRIDDEPMSVKRTPNYIHDIHNYDDIRGNNKNNSTDTRKLVLESFLVKETFIRSLFNRVLMKEFKVNKNTVPGYIHDAIGINDFHFLHHVIDEEKSLSLAERSYLVQYCMHGVDYYCKVIASFDFILPNDHRNLLINFYDTYHSTFKRRRITFFESKQGICHLYNDKTIAYLLFTDNTWIFNWKLIQRLMNK